MVRVVGFQEAEMSYSTTITNVTEKKCLLQEIKTHTHTPWLPTYSMK